MAAAVSRIADPLTGWTPEGQPSELGLEAMFWLPAGLLVLALGVWLLARHDEKRSRRTKLQNLIESFASAVAHGDMKAAEQAAIGAFDERARRGGSGPHLDGAST